MDINFRKGSFTKCTSCHLWALGMMKFEIIIEHLKLNQNIKQLRHNYKCEIKNK